MGKRINNLAFLFLVAGFLFVHISSARAVIINQTATTSQDGISGNLYQNLGTGYQSGEVLGVTVWASEWNADSPHLIFALTENGVQVAIATGTINQNDTTGTNLGPVAFTFATPVVFDINDAYCFRLYGDGSNPQFWWRGSSSDTAYGTATENAFASSCGTTPFTVMKDAYFVWSVSEISPPANLSQFKSDATSTLGNASTTTEDTVAFGTFLQASSTDLLKLEVEVSTTATTTVFLTSSTPVSANTFATTTISGLSDGQYSWRARTLNTSTSAVSAWVDFESGSSTDFVVHAVPLYTQGLSDFPSQIETDSWRNQPYGIGNYSDCLAKDSSGNKIPNTSTISRCGCAITSAAMMLRYHGITTVSTSTDVNPFTLNNYLTNPPMGVAGYDAHGNLSNAWSSGIPEYAKDNLGNARIAFAGKLNDDTPNLKTLYLDPALDQQAANPTILYERGVGSAPDHFIVATSKLASTYAVRDPRWYKTKYLAQAVGDVNFEKNYSNIVNGVRLYVPLAVGQVLTPDITMSLASPAELLVTDPAGRRLGKDPVTSTTYSEIPGASYTEEGISDPTATTTEPAAHRTKSIYIPNPLTGIYDTKVIGTASGTYEFTSAIRDASSTPHLQVFNGSTQTNLVTPYNLSYATASITVTSQIVFGGFQSPIKTDGSGIYKQGRTLPVKFQLTNASGTIITDHTAQLFAAKIQDGLVGNDEVTLSTSAADTGSYFRVDGDHYIYNLDTSSLSVGTWQLKAALDDGINYAVTISIRS